MTIYINMNDGDSDAMDKKYEAATRLCGRTLPRPGKGAGDSFVVYDSCGRPLPSASVHFYAEFTRLFVGL